MKRIEPCEMSGGRHRWMWREHFHSTPGHPVYDRWCERCGKWYTDVVIR